MQLKIFTISLDMQQSLPFHPFEVAEGDTGNVLHITLRNDGEPILLNDCAVMVLFTSSMGFSMQDETSGVTIGTDPGTFTVLLDPNNYGPGNVSVDVQVYSGENHTVLITSTRFDFRCRRSLISPEIIHANVAYPPLLTATQEAVEATAAALAAASQLSENFGEMNVQADWQETSSDSDAYIRNKPLLTPHALGAAEEVHASRHAAGGADTITPTSIGAALGNHTHGSVTNDGKIGSVADLPLFTGANGAIGTKSASDALSAIGASGNRNLLDNWDFRNPVNQRGFASGASTALNSTYFIDRWNGIGTVTWTQGSGITLAEATIFGQYVELDYHELLDKTCTVSMVVGGELKTATIAFPSAVNGATVYNDATIAGLCIVRLGFNYVSAGSLICGVSQQYVPYFRIDALSTFTIERVKVERGNISTLMLDAPMDYASMLMICQRYYHRIANASGAWTYVAIAHGRNATSCQMAYWYPRIMRRVPTITCNNISALNVSAPGGGDKAATSFDFNAVFDTGFSVVLAIPSGGAANQTYEVWYNAEGSIECDAEIY